MIDFRLCFRLRNDLYYVEWGVKLYSLTHSDFVLRLTVTHMLLPLIKVFIIYITTALIVNSSGCA